MVNLLIWKAVIKKQTMLPLNKHTKIILDLSKQRLSNCGTIYDNLIQMKHDLQKYITIKFNILKNKFHLSTFDYIPYILVFFKKYYTCRRQDYKLICSHVHPIQIFTIEIFLHCLLFSSSFLIKVLKKKGAHIEFILLFRALQIRI